jgi:hypothetical protein
VVLWVVGFFLAGSQPAFAAPSLKIVDYFHSHHKEVLIGSVLVAAGIALFLAVAAQVAMLLRDAGQPALGATVLVASGASAAVFAIGDAIYGTIGHAVTFKGADPELARTMYQLDQFAGMPMYWLVLVSVLSVAIAGRRGAVPSWTTWLNLLLAVLVVLGGVSVKASGAFAAGTGTFAKLAFGAAMVFLLELGVLLWRSAEPAQITA